MSDRTCCGCKYWEDQSTPESRGAGSMVFGWCRKNPPRVILEDPELGQVETHWPCTMEEDWCGEYQSINVRRMEVPA